MPAEIGGLRLKTVANPTFIAGVDSGSYGHIFVTPKGSSNTRGSNLTTWQFTMLSLEVTMEAQIIPYAG